MKFQSGEKVLCFHGPQMYEAKVEDTAGENPDGVKGSFYRVHYAGWSKKWDEWVPESRVSTYNPANLAKQKDLQRQSKLSKKAHRKRKEPDEGRRSSKKGRTDPSVESEADHYSTPETKLNIPDDLKHKLVDDWEAITRQQKIVKLPRDPSISKLLADYQEHAATRRGKTELISKEIVAGLKVYFEHCIGTILLYQFERLQYDQIKAEHAEGDMCDVYGTEHLLRLFVKLPSLLVHTELQDKAMTHLMHGLQDVLKFIAHPTRLRIYTGDVYEDTSAEYKRKASSA